MTTPIESSPAPLVAFPREVAAAYLQAGAWLDRPVAQMFQAVADANPEQLALVCGHDRMTYRELSVASDRRAAGLHRLGLEPGGTALLQLPNSAETVITWYALLKAGLIPVCTLSLHRRHEIREIGRQTAPVAHIVDAHNPGFDLVAFALEESAASERSRQVLASQAGHGQTADVVDLELLGADLAPDDARNIVDGIQAHLRPQDVAVFQLSGGTTGVPKVIPRLHGEYWYNAQQYARVLGWTSEDRIAYIGPLAHNAGIICGLHAPHAVGATTYVGVPTVDSLFGLLVDEQATDVVLGPAAFGAIFDPRMADAMALKRVVLSGKKVPRQYFDALSERGIWVGQLFGMGEGLCMVTPLESPAEVRATTVGVPISPHDEVRIYEPGSTTEVQTARWASCAPVARTR